MSWESTGDSVSNVEIEFTAKEDAKEDELYAYGL